MISACTALILSICCLAGGSNGNLQLYPRFLAHPNWKEGHSFPAVTDGAWLPTEPILFYESEISSTLVLQVTLAHLPKLDTVRMSVQVECMPWREVKTKSMANNITICDEDHQLPIEIRAGDGKRTADGSKFSVEISISLLQAKRILESPLVDSHRVSFQFNGDIWRLSTGWVFLKRWKWLQSVYEHGLVTNKTKYFLLGLNFSEADGFDSLPFLSRSTTVLPQGSDLLPTVASFGVTLEPDTHWCHGFSGLPFMSGSFLFNHNWSMFKSFRIDWDTGLIWFSRYGLNAGLLQFLRQAPRRSCPGKRNSNCVQILGCSMLHNAHIRHNAPYSKPLFEKWYNADALPVAPSGAAKRECFYPPKQRSKIRIYGGIRWRPVKCPIICSMADQQYGFFKDSKAMPRSNRQEFTRHGGVLVHQSGAFLLFGPNVTHEDAGKYMCSAERLTAEFEVEIAVMPRFSVPNTALVGGELPSRIHVMDGDGYSVNCTVFFSGSRTKFHLKSEFHITLQKHLPSWNKMDNERFLTFLKEAGSRGKIEESETLFSKTCAVTITKVPALTKDFDFSHRQTCTVDSEVGHLEHLRMTHYGVRSSSDILVVPRPTADDFDAKASPCCRDVCDGKLKCQLEFSLKPAVHLHLKAFGLEVRAQFVPNATATAATAAWIRERSQLHLSDAAQLTWQMDEGLRHLPTDQRSLFASLVPVFTYRMPPDRDGRPPRFSVLRDRPSWDRLSASVCHSDPLCLFATTQEGALGRLLSVADQVGISQQYLDSLPTIEPARGGETTPDQWFAMSEKAKQLLEKIFNDAKKGSGGSVFRATSGVLGLLLSVAPMATLYFIS